MDALTYLKEKNRMTHNCTIYCGECRFSEENKPKCMFLERYQPEIAIKIVKRWSALHPLETFLSHFQKDYPNIKLNKDGIPEICIRSLGYVIQCDSNCKKCWNKDYNEVRLENKTRGFTRKSIKEIIETINLIQKN